jgi:hypothetical protein
MDIKVILDFLKKPSAILIAVSLASGALLFLDDNILSKMYLLKFRNSYGIYIGATFLISTILILVFLSLFIFKKIHAFFSKRNFMKSRFKVMSSLNPAEKETIVQMYFRDTKSANLNISDSTTMLLEYKVLIGRASAISVAYTYFSYYLQPWVIDYILKYPEYTDGIKQGQIESEFTESGW